MEIKGDLRAMPENVEIVNWQKNYQYNGKFVFLSNYFLFKRLFRGERLESRSLLLQNMARANCVKHFLKGNSNSIFYSFWFDDWATILGILKIKGIISSYCARTHGFDLYTEYRKSNSIPFRNFQLNTVNKLFAVSTDGLNYLNEKYPVYAAKFSLSHLGVFDCGINPFNSDQVFTIVSCSNIARIKRVHLIVEVLKKVTCKLKWIHFGNGEVQNEVVALSKSLPSNIDVDFRGRISNQELIAFYKNNHVSLFLQFSESEGGVPVSLQEAASFGIPLLGTNVGGIPEIVVHQTGTLIPKDFNTSEVAQFVDDFQKSEQNSNDYRLGVRAFWQKNFEAKNNYNLFCDDLLKT